MPTLLNHRHPSLRILNPVTLEAIQFQGGRLAIEPDDPWYEIVMAEARRNSDITVLESIVTCPECGESFGGGTGKAQLASHRKHEHPTEYLMAIDKGFAAERNAVVKASLGFPCDLCANQTFGTEADLVLHTRTMHAAPVAERQSDGTAALPEETRERFGGESSDTDDGRAPEPVATIPAARGRGSRGN